MDPEQTPSRRAEMIARASECRIRLDRLCDAFELQWQCALRGQGEGPRIEEHLAESAEVGPGLLLRELLLVEWDYQPRLVLEDYLRRFPDQGDVVRAAFQEFRASAGPAVDEAVLRDALAAGLLVQHRLADVEVVAAAWEGEHAEFKPLEEWLVGQGTLTLEHARLVALLIQYYLDSYRGSLRAVVADLPSIHETCATLASRVRDPRLQVALRFIAAGGDREGAAPGVATVRYRIEKFHRGGGLGQVWIADDGELPRQVALKDIKPQYARHPELQARFVREAEITGLLEHPGVVPVYGLGWHPDGRPFYAMRFIQGKSLGEVVKEFHGEPESTRDAASRNLELRGLLRRFVDVCNTIEYAHSRGILHRDIKPDNIMLGKFGETLVVDWGLARVSEAAPTGVSAPAGPHVPLSLHASTLTQHGAAIGTPAFMSPEQAAGCLESLSTATDVYSLGTTLYCILTGRVPFADESLDNLVDTVKRGEFRPPREISRDVPRALDAVCRKAMAREPSARYASAKELADEIERWMADERVTAAHETWWQRLGRWARRNRTWVQAGAVGLLVITMISVVSSVVILRLLGEARASRAQSEQSLARARQSLYALQVRDAAVLMPTDPGRALELLRDPATCPEHLREFSWYYLYRVCCRNQHSWHLDHPDTVLVAFTANADMIVRIGAEGRIQLRDVRSGRIHKEVDTQATVRASALSVDRRRFATGHASGEVRVWDVQELIEVAKFAADDRAVAAVALSQDGSVVAAGATGSERRVEAWNVFDEESRGSFTGPSNMSALAISPDGTRLAAGGTYESSTSGGLRIWDLREGTEVGYYEMPRDPEMPPDVSQGITALRFFHNGQALLLCGNTGALARMDLDTLDRGYDPTQQVLAHFGTIRSLALHPAEAVIATAGVGAGGRAGIHAPHQPVKLWYSEDFHKPLPYLADLLEDVTHVSFSASGDQILTLEQGGNMTVFSCIDQWTRADLPHQHPVVAASFSRPDELLVTIALDGVAGTPSVAHWDLASFEKKELTGFPTTARAWFLPSGQVIDCGTGTPAEEESSRELRDAVSGDVIAELPGEEEGTLAAVSPDRRWATFVTPDHRLSLWDLVSRTRTAVIARSKDATGTPVVAFSPRGGQLAWSTGLEPGRIVLMDVGTTKTLDIIDGLRGGISAITFSPAGRVLAVGCRAAPPLPSRSGVHKVSRVTVTLYDAETGQLLHSLAGHAGDVYAMAFSPDGRTLATGSRDFTIRLWDVRSGMCLLVLGDHTGSVFSLDFSPTGLTLASASFDGTARLWRSTPLAQVVDHEASQFVRELADSIPLRSDLMEVIRRSPRITESVRVRSLELAEELQEDPAWLTIWSLQIAMRPGHDPREYERALRYAQTARGFLPRKPSAAKAVGVARYRCGDFAGAVEDLRGADEMSRRLESTLDPVGLAFLAMAHSRQGEREAAQETYKTLLACVTEKQLSNDAALQQILREATDVLQVE